MSKQEKRKLLNKLRLYFSLNPDHKKIWNNGDYCRVCKFNGARVGYFPSCESMENILTLAEIDLEDIICEKSYYPIVNKYGNWYICVEWIRDT